MTFYSFSVLALFLSLSPPFLRAWKLNEANWVYTIYENFYAICKKKICQKYHYMVLLCVKVVNIIERFHIKKRCFGARVEQHMMNKKGREEEGAMVGPIISCKLFFFSFRSYVGLWVLWKQSSCLPQGWLKSSSNSRMMLWRRSRSTINGTWTASPWCASYRPPLGVE